MSSSDSPRATSPAQSDALYHLAHEWMDLQQLEGGLDREQGDRSDGDHESDMDYQTSSEHSDDIEFIDEGDEDEDHEGSDPDRQTLGIQFTIQPDDLSGDNAESEFDGTEGQNIPGGTRSKADHQSSFRMTSY